MKTIIAIIVIAVVAWGAYILINRTDSPAASENTNTSESTATTTSEIREFTVSGSNFAFSPSTIRVNEGDTVRITFQNQVGTHDLVLDDFNVRTTILQAGNSETIEFVADRTGTFEYYCSVGTHRQMGMVGSLIVE